MTIVLPHIEQMPGYAEGVQPLPEAGAIRLHLNEARIPLRHRC